MSLEALRKLAVESEEQQAAPPKLARQQNQRDQAADQAAAVYQEYQAAARKSGQLQAEILKGLQAGENIAVLFLKATEAISILTGNDVFHDQAKERIITLYGETFHDPAAVEVATAEIRSRLDVLEARLKEEPDNVNVSAAVRAHRDKLEELEAARPLDPACKDEEMQPAETEPVRKARTSSSRMEEFIYWQNAFRKIGVEAGADDPDPTVESLTGPLHVKAKTIERYCQDSGQYYIDGDRVRKKK